MATIELTNANNGTTEVERNERVTFHNATNHTVELTLPDCFRPMPNPNPVHIEADANAGPYTISNNADGDYQYVWDKDRVAPRNGTIRV